MSRRSSQLVFQTVQLQGGSYPVYTGPGAEYHRVENAEAADAAIRLYGTVNGWALIGYDTPDGAYRIGYITVDALAGTDIPPLQLDGIPRVLTQDASLTDDPLILSAPLGSLPLGTPVTALAAFNENGQWAYVEVTNFADGRPARGFIPLSALE